VTKKRHQSIISLPKIVTIAALAVIATLTIDFGRRALDNYHVQRQVEWLREEVAREEEENAALREDLAYVSSDAYAEETARESLKMVKPGDTAVVVVGESGQQSPAVAPTPAIETADSEPQPYWQRWWDLFFGPGDAVP
jgi:cell division protein FtsB